MRAFLVFVVLILGACSSLTSEEKEDRKFWREYNHNEKWLAFLEFERACKESGMSVWAEWRGITPPKNERARVGRKMIPSRYGCDTPDNIRRAMAGQW